MLWDKTGYPAVPPKLVKKITHFVSAQCYTVRLDNGYGSRRLLLTFVFDRPHKSIHSALSAMLTPNAPLSESQNAKLLLLITGLLFDSVIIALLFYLSSTIF